MADLDDYLRYLADQRRRHLLYHLADEDETTVEELAASLSGTLPESAGPAREIDEVAMELRHHSLPKLDELSVVEYDPRNGVVEVREIPAGLETLLDSTRALELAD